MVGEILGRVFARGFAATIHAGTLLVLAANLGPARFGDFAAAMVAGAIVFNVAGCGAGGFALRLSAYSDRRRLAGAILSFSLVAALASGSFVFLGLTCIGPVSIPVAACAGFLVFSDVLGEVLAAVLSGVQRVRTATTYILVRRIILAFVAGLALLVTGDALLSIAVASIVCCAPYLVALVVVGRGSFKGTQAMLRDARPFWRAGIAGQLSTLDVPLVRAVLGADLGGSYATAARAASPLQMIPSSLLGVLVPRLSLGSEGVARSINRRIKVVGLVLAALVLIGAFVVSAVAPRLLGPEFGDLKVLILAVGFGVALSCISQVLQAILMADGRATEAARAVVWGVAAGLAALASAITLGGSGALPWGVVGVQVCVLVAMIRAERRGGVQA